MNMKVKFSAYFDIVHDFALYTNGKMCVYVSS